MIPFSRRKKKFKALHTFVDYSILLFHLTRTFIFCREIFFQGSVTEVERIEGFLFLDERKNSKPFILLWTIPSYYSILLVLFIFSRENSFKDLLQKLKN
jgi:hypothetical protein